MKISKKRNNEATFRASFAIVGWIKTDGIRTTEQVIYDIKRKIFSTEGVETGVYSRTDIAKLFIISEREISQGYAVLPGIGKIKIIREV